MTVSAASRRVALVTAAKDAGGAERVIETLAGHLPRHGVTPVLAAPEDGTLLSRWRALNFETCALPPIGRLRRVDLGARIVNDITRRIRQAGVDIVHAHGVAAQIHAGLAARRLRRPSVYHVHDLFERSWSADGALQRFALRVPAARVIAISETVANSLAGRVAPAKLAKILNGVESERVEPAASTAAPLVVWCGRLQRWKGPHHFIAAAAEIHRARPDVRFAIVGGTLFGLEPDYRDLLERLVYDAGLREALTLTGQVTDARPWMRASRVVVHCSDAPEPFGLVMAEAMMQERAIVAFRHGGASEIVADGNTGRLVPPHDAGALAAAVLESLADPAIQQSMGAAGRARAERLFSADGMAAAVSGVYDAVASAHA
jgi:glycosyltransferase involved in cell wall biosynthesis